MTLCSGLALSDCASPSAKPNAVTLPSESSIPLALLAPQLYPRQNSDVLGSNQAQLEPEGYLHISLKATGSRHLPLQCRWSIRKISGTTQPSGQSALIPASLIWTGNQSEYCWEWQAPPDSLDGELYELKPEVRNQKGELADASVGATIQVKIIKRGSILYSSDRKGSFDLYVVDNDGSRAKRLTFDDAGEGRPQLSPDGTRVVYTKDTNLYICDRDGSQSRLLKAFGPNEQTKEVRWNPLGTKVCLLRKNDVANTCVLCTVDADPENPTVTDLFTATAGELSFPDWRFDNSCIIFGRNTPTSEIWEYSLLVTSANPNDHLRALVTSSDPVLSARFSPNGSKLAFVKKMPRTTIWTGSVIDDPSDTRFHKLSSPPVRLVDTGLWNSDPDWSPDGNAVVFGSRRPTASGTLPDGDAGNERIYKIEPASNGSPETSVSLPGAAYRDWDPSWGR